MGEITSLFAWKVIGQIDPRLDKSAFLGPLKIDPEGPVDPSLMVPDTDYYGFLEAVARADSRGTELPLRTGASMRCADYGAFGLAFKSALDLRGSYARAERYARVLTSVTRHEVREVDEGAWFLLHREGERRLGLRLSNEASIASVHAISQEVSTEPFRPLAVHFKHPAPSTTAAHEAHFGCPVHFGADEDALLVSRASLRTPNRLGDESISTFFDTHLEETLSKLEDPVSLDHLVRIQISQSLSEGVPAITDIARRFGMSGRTLQRRLGERGHSFQTLIDQARRQLAERLLRETDYSLAEVAFLTGFSEQSAFNRAFKRWAGQTPRSFRLSASSKP